MIGRIKRKKNVALPESWLHKSTQDTVCPLCERPIPGQQKDAHHLVPKSQGGSLTVDLHRICHRQIHALFTETELARQFSTIEHLKQQDEMQRFLKWVKTKPDAFFEKSRKSARLRSK
ncbi:HNH endonuclease [Actimicrobium antarcticum]|uniref:HNH endonuclease n=1 Tax=Actimicrobium antarcticum TaxID=1051899 RepID=UPI0031DA279F